ncbi:hypothetical protein FHS43_000168 [Streptosporangium becharense]|uniref:Uncharacterized protein n=1 Tax=Streptosporangium becharense TaxID=1816182 RepID=A0A7W9MGP9_9ACTN|nr:hypothetical protein [Streptosporangium becharense]MBB2908922.1 hypothetical protein [Streptosporangium becharense]MBB5820060.1 hypothetical protein [Streptosporangium becharense]
MNQVSFCGSIDTGDYELVAGLLRDWLRTDALHVKIRLFGEEMTYEDETIYLYCYNALIRPPNAPYFLLEGHTGGTLDEAAGWLRQLTRLCAGRGVSCTIDYQEVDEDGTPVSEEEFTVRDGFAER